MVRIRENPVKSITERTSLLKFLKMNFPPLAVTCLWADKMMRKPELLTYSSFSQSNTKVIPC